MQGFPHVMEHRVIFRDIDGLGHVNNAVYATYLETARFGYLEAVCGGDAPSLSFILAELTISYRSPAFMRETLQIGTRVREIRNSSLIMESEIVEKESQRLVAEGRCVMVHYDYARQRATPILPEWRGRIARFEGREL